MEEEVGTLQTDRLGGGQILAGRGRLDGLVSGVWVDGHVVLAGCDLLEGVPGRLITDPLEVELVVGVLLVVVLKQAVAGVTGRDRHHGQLLLGHLGQGVGMLAVLALNQAEVIEPVGPGVVVVVEALLVVPEVGHGDVVLPGLEAGKDRVLGSEGGFELVLRQVAIDLLDQGPVVTAGPVVSVDDVGGVTIGGGDGDGRGGRGGPGGSGEAENGQAGQGGPAKKMG